MAQFASDAFGGSSGTLLETYNAAWTKHSSTTASVDGRISSAARCRASSGASGAAVYYHSGAPASADYSVNVDVTEVSDMAYGAGPCARMDTSANTFYHARWYSTGAPDVVQLFKFVAGAVTQLGTDQTADFTTGTTRNLKLECIGTAIKVYIDGSASPIISVTDSAITAAGKAGMRLGYGGAGIPSDTLGLHLDNFSADDTGGSPTNNLTISSITSNAAVDTLSITQASNLSISSITSNAAVDTVSVSLGVAFNLSITSISSNSAVSTVSIGVVVPVNNLTINSLSNAPTVGDLSIVLSSGIINLTVGSIQSRAGLGLAALFQVGTNNTLTSKVILN